jgi:hypothetical protein
LVDHLEQFPRRDTKEVLAELVAKLKEKLDSKKSFAPIWTV